MEPTAAHPQKRGLRELKKQRTRETILKAAFELFDKRGYADTTLDDIAEAAEVSTGTLFAYFPTKDEILFPEERTFFEQLKQRLEQRPPKTTTFDVLRDFLPTREPPDETFRLRTKIVREEGLRDRQRARYTRVERLLTDSIARDLDAAPDDLRATLLAAATGAALVHVAERLHPDSGDAIPIDKAITLLEQMLYLLRSGPEP